MVCTFSINDEIFLKLASESKKKGITVQAHIRNIIAAYYEIKEKNQTESKG
jgi:hypothetical protein